MSHETLYDSLPESAKANLENCRTPEEMHELAQEEGYELSDEQLDGISGGWSSSNPCESRTNPILD